MTIFNNHSKFLLCDIFCHTPSLRLYSLIILYLDCLKNWLLSLYKVCVKIISFFFRFLWGNLTLVFTILPMVGACIKDGILKMACKLKQEERKVYHEIVIMFFLPLSIFCNLYPIAAVAIKGFV